MNAQKKTVEKKKAAGKNDSEQQKGETARCNTHTTQVVGLGRIEAATDAPHAVLPFTGTAPSRPMSLTSS